MEASLGRTAQLDVAPLPRSQRDGLAFVAVLLFGVFMYSSITNVIPGMAVLRPALFASSLALMALAFGRVTGGLPFTFDGARGISLMAFAVLAVLSTAWSVSPETTRPESIELFKQMVIYLTIVNVVHTPKRLGWLVGATLVAGIAPAYGTVSNWVNEVNLLEGYRARWEGIYLDPNHMAMAMVALVPVAASFALNSKSQVMRVVSAVAGGLMIAAVVGSHSRGGALGLALALFLWAVTAKKKSKALFLLITVVLALVVFAPKSFWNRTETLGEIDESAMGRVYAWEVAAEINKDRPLLGVGVSGFLHAWPDYARPEARAHPYVAHNVFLAVLGELGWIGFVLFLVFVGRVVGGAMSVVGDDETGWIARGVGAGFAGYILCDMFSGYLMSNHFFFLAALAASCERVVRARRAAIKQAELEARPITEADALASVVR